MSKDNLAHCSVMDSAHKPRLIIAFSGHMTCWPVGIQSNDPVASRLLSHQHWSQDSLF